MSEQSNNLEMFVLDGRFPKNSKWLGIVFVSSQKEVFLPIAPFVNESRGFYLLAADQCPYVKKNGHIYAPSEWIKKNFTDEAYLADRIATAVLDRLQETNY